jgi:hypothetical protein
MMRSTRFQLRVVLTEHAKARMVERDLSATLILEIIDTGIQKDAGDTHYWLYKHFPDRQDNLLCVAVVIDNVLVVKTVMHHWEPKQ